LGRKSSRLIYRLRTRQSVAQKTKSWIQKQENATSEEYGIINRFTLNDRQDDPAVLGSDDELVSLLELQVAQVHLVDVETDNTLLVDVGPTRTLEVKTLDIVKCTFLPITVLPDFESTIYYKGHICNVFIITAENHRD